MHADDFSPSFDQRFVITQRLRADQRAERQTFGGNVHIRFRFSSDLDEERVLRSAFVELTRGMLEAWTKTSSHCITGLGADGSPHLLQHLNVFTVTWNISINRYIAIQFRFLQKSIQH